MNGRELVVGIRAVLDAIEAHDQGRASELIVGLFADTDDPPRCDVCGQRAWPGDDRGHIFSAHQAAEQAA